jgi:predicted ATP-grasp superfamily ATP-dependent carboligase
MTYGWCRNAWAAMRVLARRGLEVYIADSWPVFMGRGSRYATRSFRYPSFHTNPEAFVEKVVSILRRCEIGTYIPIHEETLVVARYRDRFPSWVRIPIASLSVLQRLHNKRTSAELVEELGIPAPRTIATTSFDDARNRAESFHGPCVIKLTNSNGSKGVRFAHTRAEIREQIDRLDVEFPAARPPILQQLVTGTMYAVSLLANKGEIVSIFVRRNIREKDVFGGTCTKCESIHHPGLVENAAKIVAHLGFTGPLMMEFKVDESTGEFWFIEANPRYWGTSPHDFDCGLELPYYQYCFANDIPFEPVREYRDRIKSRWLIGDGISLINTIRAGRRKTRTIGEYFRFDDDHFMDLKLDDPAAFLWEAMYYASKFLSSRSTNPVEEGMIS